jgi:hypothetical protein
MFALTFESVGGATFKPSDRDVAAAKGSGPDCQSEQETIKQAGFFSWDWQRDDHQASDRHTKTLRRKEAAMK